MPNPWDKTTAVVERKPWEQEEKPNYNMLDVVPKDKYTNNNFISRARRAFSNIGLEHIEEPAKATARGTEELVANISGLLTIASDVVRPDLEDRKKYAELGWVGTSQMQFADKVADRLREWGTTAKDFWQDQASKGWEADVAPEIWEGGFLENPSWTRAFSLCAGAIPSMAAAITASSATGNVWTGLVLLGLVEAEPVYEEAREKGVSEKKALGLFGITAGAIALTEYIPMERFLRGGSGRLIKDIVVSGLIGGTQEGTQQIITNMVRKFGIDDTTDLMEGVVDSVIAGIMSESVAGGVTSKKVKKVRNYIQTKINDVETKADELGLSKEQTDEVIGMVADSVVTHSDEVDNILNEEIKSKLKEREGKEVEALEVAKEGLEAEALKFDTAKEFIEAKLPMTEEGYLAFKGASRQGFADAALHKNIQEGRAKQEALKRMSTKDKILMEKRETLRTEYAEKIKSGEIKAPTRIDKLVDVAHGMGENEAVKAARRLLEKQGVDWRTAKTTKQQLTDIFNKAKAGEVAPKKAKAVSKEPAITKKESTILKEKLQHIEQGIRKGKIEGRKSVEENQKIVIDTVKEHGLSIKEFVTEIKNATTDAKLLKIFPKLFEKIDKIIERQTTDELVKEITKLESREVPQDYQDQIDQLMEGVELKRRTEKTKQRREKMADFLERQQSEGNLTLLPKDFFDIPTKTLDEMTVDELESMRDQISVLVRVGETKGKMTTLKKVRELNNFVGDIVEKGNKRVGRTEEFKPDESEILKTDKKSKWLQSKEVVRGWFGAHRQVEYVMKFLNGLELADIVRAGRNKHFVLQETYYPKLGEALKKLGNLKTFVKEKGLYDLTREQMVTVALNAENQGNLRRLVKGNKLTLNQIQNIKDNLTEGEKAFVEDVFNLLEEIFPEMSNTTQRMTGLSVKKIIGRYFPIVADMELSKRAEFQAAKNDLFQDIFQQTYIAHSFAKSRIGGADAVDLNGLGVITKHIDGVMHYIAFAEAVKDVQQVINHPRFKNMVSTIYNDQVYNQFPGWLKTLANPKSAKLQGPLSGVDRVAGILKRNATTAQLGIRITTSLVQAGSFTQTINEVGGNEAFGALQEYFTDRRGVTEFVFENSVQMQNRQKTFDRDVKDVIESGKFEHLTQNRKTYREILFYMIQSIDMATTVPSWLAAYNKEYNKNQNKEESVIYADHVVAITQPSGLSENLPAIMKGPEFIKIWTMFMSHFTNVHNQITFALDDLKMGTDHPLRKMGNFSRRMWFAWLLPAFSSGYIKNLGDLEKTAKDAILYPLGGLVIGRDIANMLVRGFAFGSPPALSSIGELGKAKKTKNVGKKVKHAIKAVGIATGRVPTQAVDTGAGIVDLITGETDNWLRIFFSEWAIYGGKGKRKSVI